MRRLTALFLALLLLLGGPAWAIDVTQPPVASPLGVADGGTGLTTIPLNQVPYGNGTSPLQTSGNLTFDGSTLTLTGTLAMGSSAVQFNGDSTLVTDGANIVKLVNGTTAQAFRVYRSGTQYIEVSGNTIKSIGGEIAIDSHIAGGGITLSSNGVVTIAFDTRGLIPVVVDLDLGNSNEWWRDVYVYRALKLGPGAGSFVSTNTTPLTIAGYSLTGSSTASMFTASGTLNTSGAVDVWKLAVTNTAAGAGSTLLKILGGAAGATPLLSLDVNGTLAVGAAPATPLAGSIHNAGVAFASLGTPTDGALVFCTDCDPATLVDQTCTSAGAKTGALAFRVNGLWKCIS